MANATSRHPNVSAETVAMVNEIPERVIPLMEGEGAERIFLLTTKRRGDQAYAATSVHGPMMRASGGAALVQARKEMNVNDICLCLQRVTRDRVQQATRGFRNRFQVMAELNSALDYFGEFYVAYCVIHANYGPSKDMTIFVGGDCHHDFQSLGSILSRVKNLSVAMLRKAVTVFPEIGTLHGGKKGEWAVVTREGRPVIGLSDEATVALGSLIIAEGMRFLNRLRLEHAVVDGVLGAISDFEDRNYARSDTASPDMLSGKYWKPLIDAWHARGHPLEMVTCLPSDHPHHGPKEESKGPTARGAVITLIELIERRWGKGVDRKDVHILIEGLGGVSGVALDLLEKSGFNMANIYGFDVKPETVASVQSRYPEARFTTISGNDFYEASNRSELANAAKGKPLVWFNNGPGDKAKPGHVEALLDAGVEIFSGAANNLLQVATQDASLEAIYKAGAWYWPDEVTSGGGWTLAVVDVVNRSRGQTSDNDETSSLINEVIATANLNIIDETFERVGSKPDADSRYVVDSAELHSQVKQLIDARVQTAHDMEDDELDGKVIAANADTGRWNLVSSRRPAIKDQVKKALAQFSGQS
ncbi:hypothetical protein NHF45_11475 [Maricaulaceae bacterium NA33B04]|nr:hypothetical protein [Maricaulaceae bacterium NA33B04]